MGITIHSPFYATPLFYLLYVLVGGGLIYGFFRFKQSQLLLRTSLQYERKEKERIEELNQAKLQFFSNISHEFRTPLTLIISQIELLLQSSSLAPSTYNKLLKIYRNTHSMRALISELLDFRKLEQGHVKLKVYEQNIVPFLKEIYLSFYEYASSRSITYLLPLKRKISIAGSTQNRCRKYFTIYFQTHSNTPNRERASRWWSRRMRTRSSLK